jgi:hypothetical protein
MNNPWNSLEITRLIASLLTPAIVTIIGFILNSNLKKIEKRNKTSEKILEKRLALYDHLVPMLNDILCFHLYIGNWRELTPTIIMKHKKAIKKEMYIYSPLFTHAMLEFYSKFMNLCFEKSTTFSDTGKIKSLYVLRKKYAYWEDEYASHFSESYIDSSMKIGDEKDQMKKKLDAYTSFMGEFRKTLDIFEKGEYKSINYIKNMQEDESEQSVSSFGTK